MQCSGRSLTAGQSGDQETQVGRRRRQVFGDSVQSHQRKGKGCEDIVGLLVGWEQSLAHVQSSHGDCGYRMYGTRSLSHEATLTGTQEPAQSAQVDIPPGAQQASCGCVGRARSCVLTDGEARARSLGSTAFLDILPSGFNYYYCLFWRQGLST